MKTVKEVELNLELLKDTRLKKGYSTRYVSRCLGYDTATWFRKETGERGISIEEAILVAKLYEVPVEKLFVLK